MAFERQTEHCVSATMMSQYAQAIHKKTKQRIGRTAITCRLDLTEYFFTCEDFGSPLVEKVNSIVTYWTFEHVFLTYEQHGEEMSSNRILRHIRS